MTVYLTKTWGFSVPSGPLQFSRNGWRTRAQGILSPDDLVVIVGTKGDETDEHERGRILGLMEPTTLAVSSLDYDLVRGPQDFDAAGNYKWPFGLELRRAWRFDDPRPLLTDFTARQFNMDSVQGIVVLTEAETAAILGFPRTEIGILGPVAARARVEGVDAARRKAAPPPTTTRTGIMHMRRAPAFTYAMELVGAQVSAIKIGWAFDWKTRQRQFNHASMPTIGGVRYKTFLHHLWNTAEAAFRMEQTLLRQFDNRRHSANNEVVIPLAKEELEHAWTDYLIRRRLGP